MTLSQWADSYRKLSPESSVEPGQWNTNRAPYLRDIMDVYTDSAIQRIVLMCSSQIGKSELLLCILGYHIHLDPCPILFLQPTFDDTKGFSKERIAPMIRDTPVLAKRIAVPKSRTSDNTLLNKGFTGGHVALVGTNAPSHLASRPIRTVLADECDRYGATAQEGDALDPMAFT